MNMRNLLQTPENLGGLQGSNMLRIICADDSYLNLEALSLVFRKFGLKPNCNFFSDGLSVINYFIEHLSAPQNYIKNQVFVVIIDFEMGGINGLETIKEVKAFFNVQNANF